MLPDEVLDIIESYMPISEFKRLNPYYDIQSLFIERGIEERSYKLHNSITLKIGILANEYVNYITGYSNNELIFEVKRTPYNTSAFAYNALINDLYLSYYGSAANWNYHDGRIIILVNAYIQGLINLEFNFEQLSK